jgi:hypothetical protein
VILRLAKLYRRVEGEELQRKARFPAIEMSGKPRHNPFLIISKIHPQIFKITVADLQ